MRLRQQLESRRDSEKNFRGEGFISNSALEELMVEENVREHLLECGVPFDSHMVLNIVSKASKLFALLVLTNLERHIFKFFEKDMLDDSFPIKEEDLQDIESDDDHHRLLTTQWIFPPVLQEGTHMELPEQAVLPFLKRDFAGNGTFGIIWKVKMEKYHLMTKESFSEDLALKEITPQDRVQWDTIMREVNTLNKRPHPHIVPLLASFTINPVQSSSSRSLNLLFPFANKDMEAWLTESKPPTTLRCQGSQKRREFLYGKIDSLVSALAHLHREIDNEVTAHHDLKPKNILLFGDTLKIADLGRSHLRPSATGSQTDGETGLGTFVYHPPEYYTQDGKRASRPHGRAFDVWAMGCIIVELATLVVYGWEKNMIERFKTERTKATARIKKLQDEVLGGAKDHSFHNKIDAVREWIARLRRDDGSQLLSEVLVIAEGMLREEPEERLYSWEAKLDLYELLNPDATAAARHKEGENWVQPPRTPVVHPTQNPLYRAMIKGNEVRVGNLIKAGWKIDIDDESQPFSAEIVKLYSRWPGQQGSRGSQTPSLLASPLSRSNYLPSAEEAPSPLVRKISHGNKPHEMGDQSPRPFGVDPMDNNMVYLQDKLRATYLKDDDLERVREGQGLEVTENDWTLSRIHTTLKSDLAEQERAMRNYRFTLEAFFGRGPDFPSFNNCPLSQDPVYQDWKTSAGSSVLILQGDTKTRTHFSWFAPIIISLERLLRDNREQVAFHCCQTNKTSEPGHTPFTILSGLLLRFLEAQPEQVALQSVYQEMVIRLGSDWRQLEASDPDFTSRILDTLFTDFNRLKRVFILLDRAHLIKDDGKRFLEDLAQAATTKSGECAVKLLLIGGDRPGSKKWQSTIDRLRDAIGWKAFHSINRDQGDRNWKYQTRIGSISP